MWMLSFFTGLFPPPGRSRGPKAAAAEGRVQRSQPASASAKTASRAGTAPKPAGCSPAAVGPKAVSATATCTATDNNPHHRRAQPLAALRRTAAGARQPRNRIKVRRKSRAWSFQRPPTSLHRTSKRWGRARTGRGTQLAAGARHGAARLPQMWLRGGAVLPRA